MPGLARGRDDQGTEVGPVADEKPPPEFVNALGTEYFVLSSYVAT